MKIETFAINLEKRTERKQHIIKEFEGRDLYDLIVFKAVEHEIGAIGLWKSMRKIVQIAKDKELEYVLICEDDHIFTKHYSDEVLLNFIQKSKELNSDISLGGISGFQDCISIKEDILWINRFSGTQFMIIFNKFFRKFLSINLDRTENIDLKLPELTDKIFCIFPLISAQKGFGYSDVTAKNEKTEVLEAYFDNVSKRIQLLKRVEKHFQEFYNK